MPKTLWMCFTHPQQFAKNWVLGILREELSIRANLGAAAMQAGYDAAIKRESDRHLIFQIDGIQPKQG